MRRPLTGIIEPIVSFHPSFVDAFGDIEMALFIQQLYYLSDEREPWRCVTDEELGQVTRLTPYILRRCRKEAQEKGLLTVEQRAIPGHRGTWPFYRLHVEVMEARLEAVRQERLSEHAKGSETLPYPNRVRNPHLIAAKTDTPRGEESLPYIHIQDYVQEKNQEAASTLPGTGNVSPPTPPSLHIAAAAEDSPRVTILDPNTGEDITDGAPPTVFPPPDQTLLRQLDTVWAGFFGQSLFPSTYSIDPLKRDRLALAIAAWQSKPGGIPALLQEFRRRLGEPGQPTKIGERLAGLMRPNTRWHERACTYLATVLDGMAQEPAPAPTYTPTPPPATKPKTVAEIWGCKVPPHMTLAEMERLLEDGGERPRKAVAHAE